MDERDYILTWAVIQTKFPERNLILWAFRFTLSIIVEVSAALHMRAPLIKSVKSELSTRIACQSMELKALSYLNKP